ncbi:MAG TPA: hypothetical protein DHN33_00460 [Eubacteriaceae bacterium]|nr:hypothetical protein [Eubacteriaceae bacterium]
MDITQKKPYHYYLEDDEITVARIRDKHKKTRRMKKSARRKCILFVLIIFALGLSVLYQHSRINDVNREIVALEHELEEVRMLNDNLEGEIMAGLDLNYIERYAKEELGMVRPEKDQYRTMAIANANVLEAEQTNEVAEVEQESKVVSWIVNLIN